jgi:hypothetical protein
MIGLRALADGSMADAANVRAAKAMQAYPTPQTHAAHAACSRTYTGAKPNRPVQPHAARRCPRPFGVARLVFSLSLLRVCLTRLPCTSC